jgi:hypothetical protein
MTRRTERRHGASLAGANAAVSAFLYVLGDPIFAGAVAVLAAVVLIGVLAPSRGGYLTTVVNRVVD